MLLSEYKLLTQNIVGIYAFHNLKTGKYYIGQSKNIRKRLLKHLQHVKNKWNYPLYDSINKYGFENFEFLILEETTEENLDIREKYWIKYYKSFENGYNLTSGGKGTKYYKHTDITKKKIGNTLQSNLNPNWIIYVYDTESNLFTEYPTKQAFFTAYNLQYISGCTNHNYILVKNRWIVAKSKEELNSKIDKYNANLKMRLRCQKFTNEVISDLKLLYRKDFIKKYHISTGTYHNWLKELNINKKGLEKRFTDELVVEIISRLKKKETLKKIATDLNVSESYLCRYIKKYNLRNK